MNTQKIKNRVADIEMMKDNNEAAHTAEDQLWYDVLEAIADGADNAQALAAEAVKTDDITFVRWYG